MPFPLRDQLTYRRDVRRMKRLKRVMRIVYRDMAAKERGFLRMDLCLRKDETPLMMIAGRGAQARAVSELLRGAGAGEMPSPSVSVQPPAQTKRLDKANFEWCGVQVKNALDSLEQDRIHLSLDDEGPEPFVIVAARGEAALELAERVEALTAA